MNETQLNDAKVKAMIIIRAMGPVTRNAIADYLREQCIGIDTEICACNVAAMVVRDLLRDKIIERYDPEAPATYIARSHRTTAVNLDGPAWLTPEIKGEVQ